MQDCRYQTKLSAGLDLRTLESVDLEPMERLTVDTGVYLKDVMPVPMTISVRTSDQYSDVPCAMVCSRSGLAAKDGVIVLNAPGIVDADYDRSIKVILMNLGQRTAHINKGDRIAQLVFVYAYRRTELVKDEIRTGGHGSTGT